jgi:hypothetical protein
MGRLPLVEDESVIREFVKALPKDVPADGFGSKPFQAKELGPAVQKVMGHNSPVP